MSKATHCAKNERIKRRYFLYLREAKGYSVASVDMAAAAISRFEAFAQYRDFHKFNVEQARAFKRQLAREPSGESGKPLSKATMSSMLRSLTAFFNWLADQPGYRSKIRYSDAAYFNPAGEFDRIARAVRPRPSPETTEIEKALDAMPTGSEIERRDRAVFAFIFLTGARDRAVVSFKLKHVDMAKGVVFQDAREVHTKRAKTFKTRFFPVGDASLHIVSGWIKYLREEKGFSPDDPLFPATLIALDGNRQFAAAGLDRKHWSTAAPVRAIFKAAFARLGLLYYNPHSFRSTLARLGERLCQTPEEMKAWSQNLGHEQVMTTFRSYGTVGEGRQMEIIAQLGAARGNDEPLAGKLAAFLRREGIVPPS